MADTVSTNWIYPQAWTGELIDGQGFRRVCVQLLNTSDGTGESEVIKLDISELQMPDGRVPTRTAIEKIEFNTYGMGVDLYWDRSPLKLIAHIPQDNSGCFDYCHFGGLVDPSDGIDDGTGDILLSTVGAANADSYDIQITARLKD